MKMNISKIVADIIFELTIAGRNFYSAEDKDRNLEALAQLNELQHRLIPWIRRDILENQNEQDFFDFVKNLYQNKNINNVFTSAIISILSANTASAH